MNTETPKGYISTGLAITLVLVALVVGAGIGYVLKASSPTKITADRMPRETPLEVAGNSLHVCTPFSQMGGTNGQYSAATDSTTTAYIAHNDGTSRTQIDLGSQSWARIQINLLGNDVSAIDLTAGRAAVGQIPITVASHINTASSSGGQAIHSVCDSQRPNCAVLGDIVFLNAANTEIHREACQTSPNDGKCLLYLGSLQTHPVFDCRNQ